MVAASLVTFGAIIYLPLYSQEVFAAVCLREFLLIWIEQPAITKVEEQTGEIIFMRR
jgi:hypothetical protein